MDLRLDNDNRSIEFFGIGDGLLDTERGQPVRYVDAELTQYLLGLVLMNVHLVKPPLIIMSRTPV